MQSCIRKGDTDHTQTTKKHCAIDTAALRGPFAFTTKRNEETNELVDGMHYEWIEACLDAIGDRQTFLISQSPLLLVFLPFTSAEEVQKSFLQCSLERSEEGHRGQMIWKNLSQEQVESFSRAYEAGVQHAGDILRTKGLW